MHGDNFFEAWDLSKGIAIQHNTHKVITMEDVTERSQTIRSQQQNTMQKKQC